MNEREEFIDSLDQLDSYYDGEYDWDEILENFKLTESFIRNHFDKLDKTLLLQNQDLSINFIFDYIKHLDVDDVIEYKEIKDKDLISKLREYKVLDTNQEEKDDKLNCDEVIIEYNFDHNDNHLVLEPLVKEIKVGIDSKKTIDENRIVDVEQLSIDRLRELNVPYNSIIGIHLSKVYTNKYNELNSQYQNSVKSFDDLILETLNAK